MRRTLTAVIVVGLAAGACADESTEGGQQPTVLDGAQRSVPNPDPDPDATAPDGSTATFEEAGVTFDCPRDWSARPKSEQILEDRLAEFTGERIEEGAPETAVIGVGPAPMPIDALEKSLTTGVFDPGSEVVDRADLEIEGADAARVVEIFYPAIERRNFGYREQILIVLTGGNAAILRVAAPDSQWDSERSTYEAIVESFRLVG